MDGIYQDEEDRTSTDLEKAKARLAAFEADRSGKHRMARLRLASPRHPFLLGMAFTMLSGVGMMFLAVALAVAPLVSDDVARTFATLPGINLLPVALVGLAICAGLLYGVLYGLALGEGNRAPFLPRDLKEQNRLRSDVQRLTVAADVQKRLTATPAPARLRRY